MQNERQPDKPRFVIEELEETDGIRKASNELNNIKAIY